MIRSSQDRQKFKRDQQKGQIAERKRRIKQHVFSNTAISLDRKISSNQISMTMVDPPKNQIKS
jgi:hypothetical protein